MRRVVTGVLLGALALVGVAQAEVTVTFKEPEKFTDIKDNTGFNHLEILKDLEAHLQKQAQKYLPGRDVFITVTDVDLAGQVEPVPNSSGQLLRVLKDVTLPAISLKYEVREQGRVVRQGNMELRDLGYRDGFNRYVESDRLRYERRLIDKGFEKEFGAAPVASSAASR